MRSKLLSLLGLCRKAGKLSYGFLKACEAVKQGAPLVLVSDDISPKTEKEIRFAALNTGAEVVAAPVTMAEIEQKTGRRAGVLAICDESFAGAVKEAVLRAVEEEKSI